MRYCRKDRRKKDLRILFFFLNLLRNSLYTLSLSAMHEIDLEKQFSISQLHAYSNRNELETLFLLSKKKLERSEERNTPTRQIDTRMCQRRRLHARQEIVFAKENSWKASRWRGRKNCRGKTFRMIPFSRLNLLRDAGHCGCAQWS